jgi:hypothetical protein
MIHFIPALQSVYSSIFTRSSQGTGDDFKEHSGSLSTPKQQSTRKSMISEKLFTFFKAISRSCESETGDGAIVITRDVDMESYRQDSNVTENGLFASADRDKYSPVVTVEVSKDKA